MKERRQILEDKNDGFFIGEIISDRMKSEGRSKKWLADQLGYSPSRLYGILKEKHLNTDLILRISVVMNHDYFSYLSAYYNKKKQNK
jgi:plasmid maintenance system antidote protein VapI